MCLTVCLPVQTSKISLPDLSDGGGVQRDSGLHGGVSVCLHRHDLQGFEQRKHLPGNLCRGGTAQDCLHQQLQHVSDSSVMVTLSASWPRYLHVFVPHREIDGRVYLKENDKAKQQYETAVSMGKTAGLVKYAGIESAVDDRAVAEASLNARHFCPGRASARKMRKFSVSINIAANSTVAFVLTYEELLQRKMGQYDILTRVTPKQPVQEFQV